MMAAGGPNPPGAGHPVGGTPGGGPGGDARGVGRGAPPPTKHAEPKKRRMLSISMRRLWWS